MVPTFETTCLSKALIAPGVYELHLAKPEGFDFKAGQFVLFDVPLLENENDIQARAYSIASSPHEQDLTFVIKLVPNGRASKWVEERVTTGTSITMKGPFGAFTLDTQTDKPYVFVATGTGIAPIRSHIEWALKERHDNRPMQLIFGVLQQEDLFWAQEWKALESAYPHFHAHISFLRGGTDWHGEEGSIQERLPKIISDFSRTSIYICGAPETVKDLKQRCLDWGIPKADVHTESYV